MVSKGMIGPDWREMKPAEISSRPAMICEGSTRLHLVPHGDALLVVLRLLQPGELVAVCEAGSLVDLGVGGVAVAGLVGQDLAHRSGKAIVDPLMRQVDVRGA